MAKVFEPPRWHGNLQRMPDDDDVLVGCDIEFFSDGIRVIVAKGEKVEAESHNVFIERVKDGTAIYVHRDSADPVLQIKIGDDGVVEVRNIFEDVLAVEKPDA